MEVSRFHSKTRRINRGVGEPHPKTLKSRRIRNSEAREICLAAHRRQYGSSRLHLKIYSVVRSQDQTSRAWWTRRVRDWKRHRLVVVRGISTPGTEMRKRANWSLYRCSCLKGRLHGDCRSHAHYITG